MRRTLHWLGQPLVVTRWVILAVLMIGFGLLFNNRWIMVIAGWLFIVDLTAARRRERAGGSES